MLQSGCRKTWIELYWNLQARLKTHNADQIRADTDRQTYLQIKAEEDARLLARYKSSSWRQVLIGLKLYKSQDEDRLHAKKRVSRILHPDRHKSMEDRARAEAQFVFLNGIM